MIILWRWFVLNYTTRNLLSCCGLLHAPGVTALFRVNFVILANFIIVFVQNNRARPRTGRHWQTRRAALTKHAGVSAIHWLSIQAGRLMNTGRTAYSIADESLEHRRVSSQLTARPHLPTHLQPSNVHISRRVYWSAGPYRQVVEHYHYGRHQRLYWHDHSWSILVFAVCTNHSLAATYSTAAYILNTGSTV